MRNIVDVSCTVDILTNRFSTRANESKNQIIGRISNIFLWIEIRNIRLVAFAGVSSATHRCYLSNNYIEKINDSIILKIRGLVMILEKIALQSHQIIIAQVVKIQSPNFNFKSSYLSGWISIFFFISACQHTFHFFCPR